MNKKIIAGLIILVSLASGAYFVYGKSNNNKAGENNKEDNKTEVVIYKSPNCGCCVEHAAYLEKQGFEVKIELTNDTDPIKEEHSIPDEMQSCHTTIIGDYFVEGHMPIEAITKLLKEKPDVDGIALPGMPAGSPGMPGIKSEEFEIYSLKDGAISDFISI